MGTIQDNAPTFKMEFFLWDGVTLTTTVLPVLRPEHDENEDFATTGLKCGTSVRRSCRVVEYTKFSSTKDYESRYGIPLIASNWAFDTAARQAIKQAAINRRAAG